MTAFRRVGIADEDPVEELLAWVRRGWVNGGAICAGFRPVGSGSGTSGPRPRLGAFLGSVALAALFAEQTGWWLPDGGFPPTALQADRLTAAVDAFSDDIGVERLDRELARLLEWPGAYEWSGVEPREAARVGGAAAHAMGRHLGAGATLHRADDGWHPWFHGINWDLTLVLLDIEGSAAIIAATDVD